MNKQTQLIRDLEARKALKVISGIDNFNKERVMQIVKAADSLGVSCVDICAREDIINEAVALTKNTAIVVSSVKPEELEIAQDLGADVLELGNFEALYAEGIFYSADEVLELAKKIMAFKKDALVSITVPGHLTVAQQVELSVKLEELGVDILQTEGASLVEAKSPGALGQIEKARLTLANTIEIANAVSKPYILTASGISPDTVKMAIAAGAHGVGVGKYVNKLDSDIEILAAIKGLKEALKARIEAIV